MKKSSWPLLYAPLLSAFGVAACATYSFKSPEAVYGSRALLNSGSTSAPVSDQFTITAAGDLYAVVTSSGFAKELARYNCGETVPKLTYTVALWSAEPSRPRRIQIAHDSELSPVGKTRCMLYGFEYQVAKAVTHLDPATPKAPAAGTFAADQRQRSLIEPSCNCAQRDSGTGWVTFPNSQ